MPAPAPHLEAIHDALSGAPLDRALARWSAAPPAPWHTWLLVALARQVSRQRWLMRVWRGPLADVAYGESAAPVRGLPGWTFLFHGKGLCLTAADGEIIDVDDHGDDGLTIDPY